METLEAQYRCCACSLSLILNTLKGTDDAVNSLSQYIQSFSHNVLDNFSVPHSVFFKNYLYVMYVCECVHIHVHMYVQVCV